MIRPRLLVPILAIPAILACARPDARRTPPVDLVGAGATFPYPLYRAWFSEYGAANQVRFNYFSVGSAEGLRMLSGNDVDFGATDRPPTAMSAPPTRCDPTYVPMASGAIAVAYNLSGIAGAPLHLDAPVLSAIFGGRVTRWNDARIRALNATIKLPALRITVVHRARGSGTSVAFGRYLASSGAWPASLSGDDDEPRWPVGIAAEGNEGVAAEVKVTDGAIGYVEHAYALLNRLAVATLRTSDGAAHAPSDSAGYPLLVQTWLVLDPRRLTESKGRALLDFVRWTQHGGAAQASLEGYRPLPADTVARYDAMLRDFPLGRCGP